MSFGKKWCEVVFFFNVKLYLMTDLIYPIGYTLLYRFIADHYSNIEMNEIVTILTKQLSVLIYEKQNWRNRH